MACDLQMTQHNAIKWKAMTKIYKFKAHPDTYPNADFLIGFAGSVDSIMMAVDFFNNPDSHKKVPVVKGLNGLVLTGKGDIYTFWEQIGHWFPLNEPFASVGTGSMYALGAMEMGATPKEAVKAAMKKDPYTGMGTKVFSFS